MKFEEAVDPNTLQPNPWNSNVVSPSNEDKLEESMGQLGMYTPVVVRTLKNGQHEILAGEHRVAIAKRKGIHIPTVFLGEVDDDKAKKISLVDNGRYGADDAIKLAEVLSDLGSHEDLSLFLPYSDTELSAIFSNTSIDLDDLDLPEYDEAPSLDQQTSSNVQTHQIMRQKVPVEDAQHVTEAIEYIIKTQGFDSSDSMTNAGDALVYLCQAFKSQIASET